MKEGGIYPVALQNDEYLPIASLQGLQKPSQISVWDKNDDISTPLKVKDSAENPDGSVTFIRNAGVVLGNEYTDEYISKLDLYLHANLDGKEWFVPFKFDSLGEISYTLPADDRTAYPVYMTTLTYLNDINFIDEKGEWYADRGSGTLFLYPKDNTADVEFIADDKTYISGDKLSNVKISGIKFSDTLGSAISVKNSENIEISDCKFENTSDTAVKLEKCSGSKINNCDFSNLGGGGILVDGNLNTVDNCGFSKTGCLFWMGHEPVKIEGNNNIVTHNEIADAPHSAVFLNGNENKIEFNDISGALSVSGGSVIFVAEHTERNEIVNNYIHDIDTRKSKMNSGTGLATEILYKDNRSSIIDYAITLYDTKNNKLNNNLINGIASGVNLASAKDNDISNNMIFSQYLMFQETYSFFINDKGEKEERYSEGNTVKNNFQRARLDFDDYISDGFEEKNTVENINSAGLIEIIDNDLTLKEETIKSKNPDFEMFSLNTVGRYDVRKEDEPKRTGAVTLLVGSRKFGVDGEMRINDVQPMVIDGRTLVPVRCISESFGEDVSWDADTKTVSVGSGISIAIGDKSITVGGEKKEIDVPAAIYDSRTFVPLRAIAEALGKSVTWDERGLIVITDSETEFSESELSAMIAELK